MLTLWKTACRCGAEFCYLCGLPWKTCPYEQWNEGRLLARAYDIVDRDEGPFPVHDEAWAERVDQEVQNLVENHECRHRWASRGGGHRCEECREYHPRYIFECVQCLTMVCRWCRYNRL